MIALSTPVEVAPLPLQIDMQSSVVSLGSCFADEVAALMQEGGIQVLQNPFGTLYNPLSIAQAIGCLLDDYRLADTDLVQHEGLWHSWLHHGSFSRPTREACVEACHSAMQQARQALASANLLMVTFGTAWVFEWVGYGKAEQPADSPAGLPAGRLVANCHKLPAPCFNRRRLSVAEIVGVWQPLLQHLHQFNPQLQLLFTISPIRHKADGLHGNQLSKATLLLALDQLLAATPCASPHAHYFPAYEILLDELRDYRFYAPDMMHPSPLAVQVVWQRLCDATMSAATRQKLQQHAKAAKAARHIPLHPQPDLPDF